MKISDMKKVLKHYKPPFRYDDYGQMIFDSENNLVLEVRGWGHVQYEDGAEKIQDNFGRFVVTSLNTLAKIYEDVE